MIISGYTRGKTFNLPPASHVQARSLQPVWEWEGAGQTTNQLTAVNHHHHCWMVVSTAQVRAYRANYTNTLESVDLMTLTQPNTLAAFA